MVAIDTEPRLRVHEIRKHFGSIEALSSVSFTVNRGQVVGLVGDNGAGKSTLIKILSGVYRPSSGYLEWEGSAVKIRSPRHAMALGINTIYQDLALVNVMSVWRNFYLGREAEMSSEVGPVRVINMHDARDRAANALEEVGIHLESVDTEVGQLSGGQRQAIAIARAVHWQAKLLIMDEPTSALSLKEADLVLDHIEQARRKGVSVIVITHNVRHIMSAVDRFVVIAHGRLMADLARDETNFDEISDLIIGRAVRAQVDPQGSDSTDHHN
jgi:simple sugar transport system ATP-binding protein